MATIKQIEANRRNATKSTGPRTDAGKSAVRLNALKHGLFAESTVIDSEKKDDFDKLRDSWVARWQPATPEEETLVINLVRYTWLLDRFSKVERRIWNFRLEKFPDDVRSADTIVAQAHIMAYKELDYLQRRLNSTHRNYRADLELLVKLQTVRKKSALEPAPVAELQSIQSLESEIGFVPAISKEVQKAPVVHPSSLPNPRPGGSARTVVS